MKRNLYGRSAAAVGAAAAATFAVPHSGSTVVASSVNPAVGGTAAHKNGGNSCSNLDGGVSCKQQQSAAGQPATDIANETDCTSAHIASNSSSPSCSKPNTCSKSSDLHSECDIVESVNTRCICTSDNHTVLQQQHCGTTSSSSNVNCCSPAIGTPGGSFANSSVSSSSSSGEQQAAADQSPSQAAAVAEALPFSFGQRPVSGRVRMRVARAMPCGIPKRSPTTAAAAFAGAQPAAAATDPELQSDVDVSRAADISSPPAFQQQQLPVSATHDVDEQQQQGHGADLQQQQQQPSDVWQLYFRLCWERRITQVRLC